MISVLEIYLQDTFLKVKVLYQSLHVFYRYCQIIFCKGHTSVYNPLNMYWSLYFHQPWKHSVFSNLDFCQCNKWNFQTSHYGQGLASVCMFKIHWCSLCVCVWTVLNFCQIFFWVVDLFLINWQKLSYVLGNLVPYLRSESQIFFFTICYLSFDFAFSFLCHAEVSDAYVVQFTNIFVC